jgi:hypothetical protein
MSIRMSRLVIATPVVELLAVAGMLVPSLLQLATLKATITARIFEMQATALWSAPLAGFLFCLLGGWWVARGVGVAHQRNGLLLGASVAVIDLVLLIASGAPFGALMALSFVSRVFGGYCGGTIALLRARRVLALAR